MASFDEDTRRLLRDHVRSLEASDRFYGTRSKVARERWVVSAFLANLGVPHSQAELKTPRQDPPDITFEGCHFEVKEIMDAGRRRHAEVKAQLVKARQASTIFEMIEPFTPLETTITDVYIRCLAAGEELARRKYPRMVRSSLDLLFYYNLRHVIRLCEQPFPETKEMMQQGWRSVSFAMGDRSCCFVAAANASVILKSIQGRIAHRVRL